VEREIIGENFEKRENRREKTIKKCGNKILGEIVGKKKTWEENLGK
jgi:hypothetical protein